MLRQFKFKVLCENVLKSKIVVENQVILKRLKISDNNSKISVEFAQSISTYENIHNLNPIAHKVLFDKVNNEIDLLKQKNSSTDELITTKADIVSVPTALSQLENDAHFITDISGKADISLSNLTAEGFDVIKGQIPQTKLTPFCVNSAASNNFVTFNQNRLFFQTPFTVTNAKGETWVLENLPVLVVENPPTPFVMPILSQNGVLGGVESACRTVNSYNPAQFPAYFACDRKATTKIYSYQANLIWEFYNPVPIYASEIKITNADGGLYSFDLFKLEGSNDGINYTELFNGQNTNRENFASWCKSLNYQELSHKYFKLSCLNCLNDYSQASEIEIIGTISSPIYNIYVSQENKAYALSNKIYRKESLPTMSDNDIWLDISSEPLKSFRKIGSDLLEFCDVPIATAIFSQDTVSSTNIFEFNQNGYNISTRTQSYRFPDYSKEIALANGVNFTAPADGWLRNGTTGLLISSYPINKGNKFIPSSTNFKYYPCN